uniref:Uncharacterized protein n=1 Tax=Stomoxys calcitrans TaxID=35570 RepID=A0A1I8P305_STOCA
MHSGYGGPRPFCSPAECDKFNSCYGEVNRQPSQCCFHASNKNSCDPCACPQIYCNNQQRSFMTFSKMPLSAIPSYAISVKTDIPKKVSKSSKKKERAKIEVEKGELISKSCSSDPIAPKKSISREEVKESQTLLKKNECGTLKQPIESGADRIFYENRIPSKDNLKNVNNTFKGQRSCSEHYISSKEKIFDVILDDNVVFQCQRKNDKFQQRSEASHTIKPKRFSPTNSRCRIPKPEYQYEDIATNSGIASRPNHQKSQLNSAATTRISNFPHCSSKSCSQLKSNPCLAVINEECENEECQCKTGETTRRSPSTPNSPMNCNLFDGESHRKLSKSFERTCIEFFNIISDNILESLQNSIKEISYGCSHQILKRINDMQEKLEQNENMMSQLYCDITQKIAEQNKRNLDQFCTILECLKESQPKRDLHQPTNTPICHNKECQCDLYASEKVSPKTRKSSGFDLDEFERIVKNGPQCSKKLMCKCCGCDMKQACKRNSGGSVQTKDHNSENNSHNEKNSGKIPQCDRPIKDLLNMPTIDNRPQTNIHINPRNPLKTLYSDLNTSPTQPINTSFTSDSKTSMKNILADKVTHFLSQCHKEFQASNLNDDHETSGYATDPEDNGDDLSYVRGVGGHRKLTFEKSKLKLQFDKADGVIK